MDSNLKVEYERIGQERTTAGREHDRARRRFLVATVGWMWLWTLAGIVLIVQSAHINARIGPIELPRRMLLAQTFFWGGLTLGAAGSLGSLIVRWRKGA